MQKLFYSRFIGSVPTLWIIIFVISLYTARTCFIIIIIILETIFFIFFSAWPAAMNYIYI